MCMDDMLLTGYQAGLFVILCNMTSNSNGTLEDINLNDLPFARHYPRFAIFVNVSVGATVSMSLIQGSMRPENKL